MLDVGPEELLRELAAIPNCYSGISIDQIYNLYVYRGNRARDAAGGGVHTIATPNGAASAGGGGCGMMTAASGASATLLDAAGSAATAAVDAALTETPGAGDSGSSLTGPPPAATAAAIAVGCSSLPMTASTLDALFRHYDTDFSGFLEIGEVMEVLEDLGVIGGECVASGTHTYAAAVNMHACLQNYQQYQNCAASGNHHGRSYRIARTRLWEQPTAFRTDICEEASAGL